MGFSRTKSPRSRGRRSAEDESPVIVSSIAIMAVIVFSCVGMIAPVSWDAFTGGAGPLWGAQSCRQGTGAADAATCPERAPLQASQPRPKGANDPAYSALMRSGPLLSRIHMRL
jgi:hypothetical protein